MTDAPKLLSRDELDEALLSVFKDASYGSDFWHAEQRIRAHIAALEAELDALQAFKIYVHNRLTLAGIATHPDGPHTKQGCRIGDRLDIVLAERDALRSTLLAAHHAIVSLDEEIFGPIMDAHGEHCGWVRDELLAQMRARLG